MNVLIRNLLILIVINIALTKCFQLKSRNLAGKKYFTLTTLHAKKSSKNRSSSKGFGAKSTQVKEPEQSQSNNISLSPSDPSTSILATTTTTVDENTVPVPPKKESVEKFMNRYGISSESKSALKSNEPKGFGESVLDRIPDKLQARIDGLLLFATFTSLGFVILSGVGISSGAFKVVFPDSKIPESLEFINENILSPSFTPSIVLFFIFSITFGLFKYAQVSSNRTVYKE